MRDRARSLAFWRDLLGLEASSRADGGVALRPRGGERDLLRLEIDPDAPEPSPRSTGLFHVALLLPHRAALAHALRAIEDGGGRPFYAGAADHAVSEALYFTDPEGNGLELYADRPRETWRRRPEEEGGELIMTTDPLDLRALLSAVTPGGSGEAGSPAVPSGTRVGHLHLRVEDLWRTGSFYRERLGMGVTVSTYPGALFLSWGGYHHHLGLNIWGAPASGRPEGARGLVAWEARPPGGGHDGPGESTFQDPDGIVVRVAGRSG